MKLLVLLALLGCCLGARAQADPRAARFSPLLAELLPTTSEVGEVGSGFVVGASADSVYVVTAAHVLGQATAPMLVRLAGWTRARPARVRHFAYQPPEDLALLAVPARAFRQLPASYCPRLSTDDSLCFAAIRPSYDSLASHLLLHEATLLPFDEPGTLHSTLPSQHRLRFWLGGVRPGDSGSALLLDAEAPCVVGMIVEAAGKDDQPHTAVSIDHIRAVLLPRLGSHWQLTEQAPRLSR